MLTRARQQAAEMTSQLERLGARVIHYPMIETVPPASWRALDEALDQLNSFDWLIFTSVNGVRFFFQRLAERRRAVEEIPPALKLCAIGPGTAAALQSAGLHADVVARESRAEGMLAAFLEAVGDPARLSGLRVLIPRARVARDILPDELRRLGASVRTVEVYETIRPPLDGAALVRMLGDRQIDAVTFTSPSTVSNFAALVGREEFAALLSGVVAACIGPVTAATAAEFGLTRIVQPEIFTVAALIEALDRAFRSARSGRRF